jgi:hypothetical protein
MDFEYFEQRKEKAKAIFTAQENVFNPYLKSQVIFNSDGFHHLQFSARRERNKEEQVLKFNLLPLAIDVIKQSGTLQEYRKMPVAVGKKGKDGFRRTKEAEFWGFFAIMRQSQIRIRVILRRIGDGNIIFWSVLPHTKLKGGQKIYTDGIDDD